MDIIIDGYNLIFQCGLQSKSTASDALERSRNRLIDEIASFAGVEVAKKTTIVFDANYRPLAAKTNRYRLKNVLVLYADRFEDADSMIEHLIVRHSVPKKLTIVSSDHRLHKAATRRKAIPVDSEIWYDRLIGGKLVSKTSVVKLPPPEGLSDVDWHQELDVDGVDVRAIEAELEMESEAGGETDLETGAETKKESQPNDAKPIRSIENPFPHGYGEDLIDDESRDRWGK